jgi:hypothetical protein
MEIPNKVQVTDSNIDGVYDRVQDVNNSPCWQNNSLSASIEFNNEQWVIKNKTTNAVLFIENNWPNVVIID